MLTKENANLVRFRFHWKARLGNFVRHRGEFLLKEHTSFFVFFLKMDIFKGLWFLIFSILNFLLNSCFWLQYWLIHHVCMFWLYDFQNEKLAFVLKQLQILTWLPLIHHQGINQEMKAFACKEATLTILTLIFVNTVEYKLHISLCIFPTRLYIPDDTCLLHWHDWMQKGGAKTRIFYFCHKSCRQNTLICFRTKCLLSIFRGIHLWRFNTQFKIELGIYFTSGLADMSVKVMAILLFRLGALQVNFQKLQILVVWSYMQNLAK